MKVFLKSALNECIKDNVDRIEHLSDRNKSIRLHFENGKRLTFDGLIWRVIKTEN